MYYNVIKKHYKNDVSLIYMDTDSFLLNFDGIDILDEVAKGPLANYMDLSNFDVNHPSYNNANKGKLGLLKSETGSIPLKEAICLQPKCYSILLDNNSCKSTAKGVNRSSCKNLKHSVYNEIHEGIKSEISVDCVNIRCKKNKLYTVQTRKRALAKLDRKRWYVNGEKSLGFGHPDIPLQLGCENQCNPKRNPKRKILETLADLHTDLTFNRAKREKFFKCM